MHHSPAVKRSRARPPASSMNSEGYRLGEDASLPPQCTEATAAEHRSGLVAIIGRPNVGKSTLLNRILGQKIAIVTSKPQTTRRRILGVKTLPEAQILFLDTPGIHRPRDRMTSRMVARANAALEEADLRLWLVDCQNALDSDDTNIAALLRPHPAAALVALNKMDRVPKPHLLPRMREVGDLLPGCPIVPVSGLTGENLDVLLQAILERLPQGPRYYPHEDVTDETERDLVGEIIREKIMIATRQEVPYDVAVTVDSFEDNGEKGVTIIRATIHVNRASQKPILLGRGGSHLKAIGMDARGDIEELLGRPVFLDLFIRVRQGWTKEEGCLKEFGL
jgi:GTPase